jgi:hypothetical protein
MAVVVLAGGALAIFRYLPALDDARGLRVDVESLVNGLREKGMGIDRSTMDDLDANLASARSRLARLEGLLGGDPLIAFARVLPPTAANVRGADDLTAAAGNLLDAVGDGLVIGRRFVDIREPQTAGQKTASALSRLVELMATSRDRAVSAAASVASARRRLATIPNDLASQVVGVRDAMTKGIDAYGPLLDTYVDVSTRLPAILGWDAPRRYLILTQDPAEMRPTGGFIGSYGIITFDHGKITDESFHSVDSLPVDYPRIDPPQPLADYLLGPTQSWEFSDANWSPDFPTSARDAMRLYANETEDAKFDGVLGITTYTIDELLKVTGPISVPDYKATIAPGETTLKVLQLTRAPVLPGKDKKAFLPAFADRLITSLLALPPQTWPDLLDTTQQLQKRHLLLTWFRDSADEELAVRGGFDGGVRQDPGDFVYPVDSNVAPPTKLNAWTTRSLDLAVQIDAVGNARDTLAVTWDNQVDTPIGAPYRAMTGVGGHILGMYFRLLVPERSRVDKVSGGGLAEVTVPAVEEEEAGRMAIGSYLKIPAGKTSLKIAWTSPYAADSDATGGTYRLTVQRQAGMRPGPIAISIRVPEGFRITAASPELEVSGALATLTTTFDRDVVLGVRYGP